MLNLFKGNKRLKLTEEDVTPVNLATVFGVGRLAQQQSHGV